jgi:serine/threonine-protein kinase
VLDFGLAAVEGREQGPSDPHNSPTVTISPTRAGVIMGTAAYMSPEQARGKPADKRSDIWAFGVVLYEMFTGKPLFQGETVSDVLVEVLGKEPDLRALPPHARYVVERCLRKDARRRWQAIGDVRLALEEGLPEAAPAAPAAATKRAVVPWALAGALLLVAAATSFTAWRATRSAGSGDLPLIRLDTDLGPETQVSTAYAAALTAISPDGRRLVYPVRGPDGKQMLASRLLDKPAGSVIAGTTEGSGPFFSPDSQSIGFFADGKLKTVALNGGVPVTLADAANPRGASWGEDGTIVAALSNTSGLHRIPASGGPAPQPITQLRGGEVTHRWPQVLPGGRAVLFTASKNLSNYEGANLEVLTYKTGERRVIQQGGYFGRLADSGHLLYVHEGALFALPVDGSTAKPQAAPVPILDDVASSSTSAAGQFDLSRTGIFVYRNGKAQPETWSIAVLDARGPGRTQPQLSQPAAYFSPRFSPDGQRLALGIEEKGVDLYVYDMRNDVLSRLTFTAQLAYNPVWTPDGKHIIFEYDKAGSQSIVWIRSDGAGEMRTLVEGKASVEPHSISSDGRRMAYQQQTNANFEIWTLPLDATDLNGPKPGTPELFARATANEVQPAFSPDGRWMAYASDESGVYEVYVRPFPSTAGGGKWQVSSGGGKIPVWSRDGRSLFFETLDNRIIVAGYTANGATFAANRPRLWSNIQLTNPTNDQNFDLSPDGTTIEALAPTAAGENRASVHVTFLLNFFDELRRKAPPGR